MTLRSLTLTPLSHARPRPSTLKYVLGTAAAIFCLINVYRSTVTSDFTSSHDYLENSEVRSRHRVASTSLNASSLKGRNATSRVVDRLAGVKIPNPDDTPRYNKSVKGQTIPVPLWQRRLWTNARNKTEEKDETFFYLAELLQVRIYSEDKARWSVNELKQWMHYLFLAGVQHVYLCDHYMYESERLDRKLAEYIRLGLVTYLPWGQTRDPMTAQVRCYQRFINLYRRRHVWQIAVDMDEYPFAPNDTSEDFLIRFLRSFPHHVTEISMPNFLMLGRGDRGGQLVIERINRMVKQSNALVKPIYRPQRVNANVHHNHLLSGSHVDAKPDDLRMLHYWGARSQQWGPDTPKTISMTTEWNGMKDVWSQMIRNSLLAFAEFDAITNTTGP